MDAHSGTRPRRIALMATCVALIAGCSTVAIYKLDRNTGKIVPDAAEGARYYLPRPYVSVFEPFIIASDVYLAAGQLTLDSNHVLLTEVPQGLDSIVNNQLKAGTQKMGAIAIDASTVFVKPPVAGPQSAPLAEAGTGVEPAKDTAKDVAKDAAKDAGKDAAKDAAKDVGKDKGKDTTTGGGLFNYEVKNDNAGFAVTPQPRYFNILWLPDFDEQYVVKAKPGLGNTTVSLTTGQGWNLQGVNIAVDNSAIVKPILDFYSGTLGALQKLAVAKIEGPLALLNGTPQAAPLSGAQTAKTEFAGGTPVTVKVTRVRVVAPGLYPILKPNEIATLSPEESKRILIPKPPLTNIAFNTYDVIVIEAARATGDSALRIQQYVDSASPGATPMKGGPAAPSPTKIDLVSVGKALNVILTKPENVTTQGQYYVASVTAKDNSAAVQLKATTGASPGKRPALPTEAEIKGLVVKTLTDANVPVNADNVTIVQ